MEIVVYPDPVLRKIAEKVTDFGPELAGLTREMLDFMYSMKGVGLAAPQVGISRRIFVMNPTGDPAKPEEERVLINPRIVKKSGQELGEEGCLSFPGIYGEVLRSRWIKVEAQDLAGEPVTLEVEDFTARVLQHELDHLEGILFVTRLEPADKLLVRKSLEGLEEEFRRSRAADH